MWIYSLLFQKKICGKTWIEESMTTEHGSDWLDQVMDGLRNPEVRKQLREDLNLRNNE